MNEALHLEIRKKIYKLILKNPGINLSTIAEILGISVQLADYHLHYLVENGIITVAKEGGYRRYYERGKIGVEDKKILSLLNQDVPLNIILILLRNRICKPGEIRKQIKVSAALLTYYLKKLVKYDIIATGILGEKKGYTIVNEQQVMKLLILYKPNILLERFKKTWLDEFPLSSKLLSEEEEEENQQ
jgi:predicted transcriptional regulator